MMGQEERVLKSEIHWVMPPKWCLSFGAGDDKTGDSLGSLACHVSVSGCVTESRPRLTLPCFRVVSISLSFSTLSRSATRQSFIILCSVKLIFLCAVGWLLGLRAACKTPISNRTCILDLWWLWNVLMFDESGYGRWFGVAPHRIVQVEIVLEQMSQVTNHPKLHRWLYRPRRT